MTTVIVLIVIASILLVLVILSQNSKGGGMTGMVGNSGASQILGARKTGDFLERSTWVLIAFIFLASVGSAALMPKEGTNKVEDAIDNITAPSTPGQDLPFTNDGDESSDDATSTLESLENDSTSNEPASDSSETPTETPADDSEDSSGDQ